MKHPGRTPRFRGPHGNTVPGSIAEIQYQRLGGMDQWVMMRGLSVANPPLIHLHGGPGLSEMRVFRHYNWPLEKTFTVVSWDQRGTSKSFDRTIPRSSMTVEQFLHDLDDLVEVVRTRLEQPRVVLFGHSWGSALGVLYAARFPDKVAAYVGSGQIGDWAAGEAWTYAYTLAEAERRSDRAAVIGLRAIGPPPHTGSRAVKQRLWLMRLDGELSARSALRLSRVLLGGSEFSLLDLPNLARGMEFSMDAMWAEVTGLDLIKLVPALRTPVFVLVGRRDHIVPPETSLAFFDALTAPSKELVWFEQSGHEPFIDEPAKFNALVVESVLPAIRQPGSG